MSQPPASIHRQRAAHLRRLAQTITDTPSMQLQRFTTADTWYGPRPDACNSDLGRARRAVRDAVDDLRRQAIAFERMADELDAAAVAATAATGRP